MEGKARAAGARFEVRDGWNVAVEYPGEDRVRETVGWTDVSHLRKLELQGDDVPGELGEAKREGDAWICQLTANEGPASRRRPRRAGGCG